MVLAVRILRLTQLALTVETQYLVPTLLPVVVAVVDMDGKPTIPTRLDALVVRVVDMVKQAQPSQVQHPLKIPIAELGLDLLPVR